MAVHAVSCELVSCFPVFQGKSRELCWPNLAGSRRRPPKSEYLKQLMAKFPAVNNREFVNADQGIDSRGSGKTPEFRGAAKLGQEPVVEPVRHAALRWHAPCSSPWASRKVARRRHCSGARLCSVRSNPMSAPLRRRPCRWFWQVWRRWRARCWRRDFRPAGCAAVIVGGTF